MRRGRMDDVSISVNILDRRYKLRINTAEEEYLRKAAELIDTQARSYGKIYTFQDHQDLLAMVALTQITQLTKIQDNVKFKDTKLMDKLNSINQLLSEHVEAEKD